MFFVSVSRSVIEHYVEDSGRRLQPRRTYSILLFYFIGFCGRTFIVAFESKFRFATTRERQIRRIMCTKNKRTLPMVAVSDERRLYATYYLHRVADLTAFETTKSNFKFLAMRNGRQYIGWKKWNTSHALPCGTGLILYHSRHKRRLKNWPTEAADELLHLSVSNAIVTDCNYELNLHLDQCANWPNRLLHNTISFHFHAFIHRYVSVCW